MQVKRRTVIAAFISLGLVGLLGCGEAIESVEPTHHAILGGSASCDNETITFTIGNSEGNQVMSFESNFGGGTVPESGSTSITIDADPGTSETILVNASWPNGVTWSGEHTINVPDDCVPPDTTTIPPTTVPDTTTIPPTTVPDTTTIPPTTVPDTTVPPGTTTTVPPSTSTPGEPTTTTTAPPAPTTTAPPAPTTTAPPPAPTTTIPFVTPTTSGCYEVSTYPGCSG